MPQLTAAQELQIKAQKRLASLMEEKLVTRIYLFAGSDGGAERWATVCSLIASAKLNDVEPFAYLRDILQRMTEGHAMSRLDELLPWNWPKMRVNH